jgi:hypothetical protein
MHSWERNNESWKQIIGEPNIPNQFKEEVPNHVLFAHHGRAIACRGRDVRAPRENRRCGSADSTDRNLDRKVAAKRPPSDKGTYQDLSLHQFGSTEEFNHVPNDHSRKPSKQTPNHVIHRFLHSPKEAEPGL